MQIFSESDFKGSIYPDTNVSDAEKNTKEFGLRMIRYMYGTHLQWGMRWRGWVDQWELNYLYMEGNQPIGKYTEAYSLGKGSGGSDESAVNIDYAVLPIAPKYMDLVKQKTSRRTRVMLNAVNPLAETARDRKEYYLRAQIASQEFLAAMEEEFGIELLDKDPEIPKNNEDLEVYKLAGGLKLSQEIGAELGIELVMGEDKWKEIEPELIMDSFCTRRAVAWEEEDSTGKLRVYSVRPQDSLFDYSRTKNYSDARYGGRFKRNTIAEFRALASGQVAKEELDEMCRSLPGRIDTYWLYSSTYNNYNTNPSSDREQWIVTLPFYFRSTNKITKEEMIGKYGDMLMNDVPEDYEVPEEKLKNKRKALDTIFDPVELKKAQVEIAKLEKQAKQSRKKIQKEYEVIYKGEWIIGTDIILNYGLLHNQGRNNGKYKTPPPMHVWIENNRDGYQKPRAQMIIPALDMIQKAWLKHQSLTANEPPPGYTVDVNGVLNVDLGQGPVKATDLVKMWKQTGAYYYNGIDPITGERTDRPINPMILDFSIPKQRAIEDMLAGVDIVRQILGFNETTDASTVPAKTGLGVSQGSFAATNNVLTPFAESISGLKLMVAGSVLCRIKVICKNREMGGYMRKGIGEGYRFLTVPPEVAEFDYEFELEEMMSDEAQQVVEGWIQTQLSVRQQGGGVGGIDIADALMIRRCKNLKQAELLLIARVKKRQQEDMAMKQEMLKSEMAKNEQASTLAAQNQQALEDKKFQQAIALKDKEAELMQLKFNNDMAILLKTIELEGMQKSMHIHQEGVIKEHIEGMKQDTALETAHISAANKPKPEKK